MQGVQGSRPLPCIHAHNLALCPPCMPASHALGSALDLSAPAHAVRAESSPWGIRTHEAGENGAPGLESPDVDCSWRA